MTFTTKDRALKRAAQNPVLVALAVSAPLTLGQPAAAQDLAEDQSVVMGGMGSDIKTIDPMFQTETMNDLLVHYMYSYLTQSPYGTMDFDNVEGDVAESWDILEDGKVWVFRLKQGIYFHDGNAIFPEGEAPEMTAEDVKYTYERLMDPAVASPHRGEFDVIDRIDVVDKYTVKFTMKYPYPFFHLIQAYDFKAGAIVSKVAAEKMSQRGNWGMEYTIGSGPFEFESYTPKESVVLKSNEDYFKGAPTIQRFTYRFMPDVNSRTLSFIAGETDMIYGERDAAWVESLTAASPDSTIMAVPLGSGGVMHYNMTVKPLDDIRVRKALSYALCRQSFKNIFSSIWSEQTSIVPPSYTGALQRDEIPEDLLYECDLDKAKALLEEAGHADGFKLHAYTSPSPAYQTLYVVAQDAWRKIGVELDVELIDHTSYLSNILQDMNDVVGYSADRTPIADSYLSEFWHSSSIVGTPSGQKNFSHYGSLDADGDGTIDSVDELIEKARAELDPELRSKLWKQAQLQVLEDAAAKPLHVLNKVLGHHNYVDLGVDFTGTMSQTYPLERARVLKH